MSSASATPNRYPYQNQSTWSKSQKAIARTAFDAALEPETHQVMEEAKQKASQIKEPGDLWDLEHYPTERRKATAPVLDSTFCFAITPTPDFFKFFLNATGHVHKMGWGGYPLDNRRAFALGNLCRELCLNPRIPTRVAWHSSVSFAITSGEGKSAQTDMNTSDSCHSDSFGIARRFCRQRTVTAEAAGSSPVVPAIFFKHLPLNPQQVSGY